MIPVYIFNGRKQTLVNTIGLLPALRMRGLHDKRHLSAKLRICDSKNCNDPILPRDCRVPLNSVKIVLRSSYRTVLTVGTCMTTVLQLLEILK